MSASRARVVIGAVALGVLMAVASSASGSSEDSAIPAEELAHLPPIAFSWADRDYRKGAGDVYVAGADGSGLTRLKAWRRELKNDRVFGADRVAWSPDRRQIAVQTWGWIGDPASRVAVVSADGKALRSVEGWDWNPRSFAWSPDGATLLFSRFHELFVLRPATGRTARIWRSYRDDSFEGVDWAPDGREVVATSADRGLVRMTPAGEATRWVARAPASTPHWSPSGREIVFTRGSRVHSVGRDGTGLRLLNKNAQGYRPLWSPNGRSILFTGSRRDVFVMPAAAGRPLRRLGVDAAAEAVDWSPDGSKILFRREVRDPSQPSRPWWELWVMDADGGRQTRLPFNRRGWSVLAADWRS